MNLHDFSFPNKSKKIMSWANATLRRPNPDEKKMLYPIIIMPKFSTRLTKTAIEPFGVGLAQHANWKKLI